MSSATMHAPQWAKTVHCVKCDLHGHIDKFAVRFRTYGWIWNRKSGFYWICGNCSAFTELDAETLPQHIRQFSIDSHDSW